jgi:transposase
LPFENLLADKGYDSDKFRAAIAERGAEAVIPSSRSRSQAIPYDKHLYKERNLVERFINKIKHYRRIATVITHPVCAGRAPAAWAAGSARASRMAVRALRPLRRPVSTIEQRAA